MSNFNFLERIIEEVLDELLRTDKSLHLDHDHKTTVKKTVYQNLNTKHHHLQDQHAARRVQGVDLQLKADILLEISRVIKTLPK